MSSANDREQNKKMRAFRRRRLRLRTGQILMLAGVVIFVVHWLAHLEAFGPSQPEGWVDLVAGYPMGALLLIAGAMLASRRPA